MLVDETPVCVSQCYTKQVSSFMVRADGEFCDSHSAIESACNRVLIKASSVTSLKAFFVVVVRDLIIQRVSNEALKSTFFVIIIIDNFCIALFSGVPKLTALYILQHFLSFTNIIQL